MSHAIIYLGHYEHSFHRLTPDGTTYWNKAHPEGAEITKGSFERQVEFGALQTDVGFVFVRVGQLLLPNPTAFVAGRHAGKGLGVQPNKIDDPEAFNILLDLIAVNPGLRDELGAVLWKTLRAEPAK